MINALAVFGAVALVVLFSYVIHKIADAADTLRTAARLAERAATQGDILFTNDRLGRAENRIRDLENRALKGKKND